MTITQDPLVLECMPSSVLTPVPDEEVERVAVGEERSLVKMFWFGLPGQLLEARIEPLQAAGALVIPAINVFRYPREDHEGLARKDIERLQAADVDGFQIDSIYRGALPSRA